MLTGEWRPWLALGFVGVFMSTQLIALVYPWYRRARSEPPSRWTRLATLWTRAGLLAFLSGAFLSPPDPFSQIRYLALAFPVCLLVVVGYRRLSPLQNRL